MWNSENDLRRAECDGQPQERVKIHHRAVFLMLYEAVLWCEVRAVCRGVMEKSVQLSEQLTFYWQKSTADDKNMLRKKLLILNINLAYSVILICIIISVCTTWWLWHIYSEENCIFVKRSCVLYCQNVGKRLCKGHILLCFRYFEWVQVFWETWAVMLFMLIIVEVFSAAIVVNTFLLLAAIENVR